MVNIVFMKTKFQRKTLFFSVDAIFTGEFKQYKKVGNEYKSFELKINQEESDTVTQQSDEQPDLPELESKESQLGRGLKIATPNQMLNRLPISIA